MRFYDADLGQILIDDIDIKSYNIRQLRQLIGHVMEDPEIFNCTFTENILYGKPESSNAEIVDACKVANATDFIQL
jgi:ABC-type multidrug transport system fused ATPase/permease subunit